MGLTKGCQVQEVWYQRSQRKPILAEKLREKLTRAVSDCTEPRSTYWLLEIDRILVDELGPWPTGWRWGFTDGGPVSRWCCFQHSFLKGNPKEEPARTVDLILAGVEDWDKVLSDCEALFERLVIKEPLDLDIAVLELVNFAVEATNADDAWYGFCHNLLSWYLQHLGIPPERASGYARKAIAGQFESWIAPSEELKERVAESFRDLAWRALAR